MPPISFKHHRLPPDVIRHAVWQIHRPGRLGENNRIENSLLPIRRRERQQQRFKSQSSAQRFLGNHAGVYNTLNVQGS